METTLLFLGILMLLRALLNANGSASYPPQPVVLVETQQPTSARSSVGDLLLIGMLLLTLIVMRG